MRDNVHRILLLTLLLTAMTSGRVCAQMPTYWWNTDLHKDDTSYICTSGYGYIKCDYWRPETYDSWAIINSTEDTFYIKPSYMIAIRGQSVSNELNGYIDIWTDSSSSTYRRITLITENDSIMVTGHHATMHVHFNASPTIRYQRTCIFTIGRNSTPSQIPCSIILSIAVNRITTTAATLHFSDSTHTKYVTVNGQPHTVTGDSLRLTGLTPNTEYIVKAITQNDQEYPCCTARASFWTDPESHTGCPDVLNLHSNYVRGATYQNINLDNPNADIGIVNFGSSSFFSRHSVHTDPNETDPNTGNLLHTVGPGLPGTVKLGNNLTGGEAESITYYLHVDTLLYSLIMLHYAAVLQNPDHTQINQPRFRMEILDQNDSIIDPTCGAADFIASTSLGWNAYEPYEVLWKDWTTIGVNLAPYHGQDVRLRLTSYDCKAGGHFGYAYFYAECQQPSIRADHCGVVDTITLTAPNGFNYQWYNAQSSAPFSTDQTIVYPTSRGNVRCKLSFIENPTCYLNINAYVTNYWPQAIVDTLYTIDHGCDGYEVQFINRSTIVDDNGTPLPGNATCESAQWFFGDRNMSARYSPSHTYQHSGTYTVTLIVGLSNQECTDTVTYTITTPDAWAPADQVLSCCDSLLWIDSLWYSHDTVGPTCRVPFPETCDTIYTLHLTTLPTSHFTLPVDTICYTPNHFWRGHMVASDYTLADTAYPILTDTLLAANGCDSLVHQPLVQLPPDQAVIMVEPDCVTGQYSLSAVTDKHFWLWSSSPLDSALLGHEHDTTLMVNPDSAVVYTLTTYYNDTLFCPTSKSQPLAKPNFPHVELEVNPNVLTFERQVLYAYDRSEGLSSRQWTLVNHGISSDTVRLPDTERRIVFPVDIDNDSVSVILNVGNNFCQDTLRRTIPIILTHTFAPNVFTPDADNNNRFVIVGQGILESELTIYNRQGLLVFTTNDIQQGWDGTHNGTPCPQGAYVWHLRVRTADRPDDWRTSVGTVTLLR